MSYLSVIYPQVVFQVVLVGEGVNVIRVSWRPGWPSPVELCLMGTWSPVYEPIFAEDHDELDDVDFDALEKKDESECSTVDGEVASLCWYLIVISAMSILVREVVVFPVVVSSD